MFSALAAKANKILRDESEKNKELDVSAILNPLPPPPRDKLYDVVASLSRNETKAEILLDELWDQFEFTELKSFKKLRFIIDQLSKEVITFENKCLTNESCWSTAEKMLRSVLALSYLANQPQNFGNYLSYHVTRLFKSQSYIQPNIKGTLQ